VTRLGNNRGTVIWIDRGFSRSRSHFAAFQDLENAEYEAQSSHGRSVSFESLLDGGRRVWAKADGQLRTAITAKKNSI
jgi:hypothetical protein